MRRALLQGDKLKEDGINANSATLCVQSRWCVAAAAAEAPGAAVSSQSPQHCHRPPHPASPGSVFWSRSASASWQRTEKLKYSRSTRSSSTWRPAAVRQRRPEGGERCDGRQVCSNQAPPTHLPHTPPWLGAGVRCGPLSGLRLSGEPPPFNCFQRSRRASGRSRCEAGAAD